jgi:hypothetical protein
MKEENKKLLWVDLLEETGVVAVLFAMGLFLRLTNVETDLGNFALLSATALGMISILLGIAGILKNLNY